MKDAPTQTLPWTDPDDRLARDRAVDRWTRHMVRTGESLDYVALVRSERDRIRTLRAAGIDPLAPNGEDGTGLRAPDAEPTGKPVYAPPTWLWVAAGLLSLCGLYVVAINW